MAGLLLSSCTADEPTADPNNASETVATSTTLVEDNAPEADPGLPHDALPAIPGGAGSWDECPYLDTNWVAETNGQRTIGVGTDSRFDTPACVFWSYSQTPQLTVIVRNMPDEDSAIAVTDWAAPIDTTEPAEDLEGWSGGRAGAAMMPEGLPTGHDGALYAVHKDNKAVVVFTDQEQSIKAELVLQSYLLPRRSSPTSLVRRRHRYRASSQPPRGTRPP